MRSKYYLLRINKKGAYCEKKSAAVKIEDFIRRTKERRFETAFLFSEGFKSKI